MMKLQSPSMSECYGLQPRARGEPSPTPVALRKRLCIVDHLIRVWGPFLLGDGTVPGSLPVARRSGEETMPLLPCSRNAPGPARMTRIMICSPARRDISLRRSADRSLRPRLAVHRDCNMHHRRGK